eukprot:CAMPEP_0178436606 /NCGR_PEP_ID=MMETSP0689_2-20121128/34528_1 /TAXON_ID=160604 /ORGANISM="Amphidinium massartii, Strain CS-259" /LENGTH=58 /DNA_ID=CAMNT_0020058711 /DNA_START=211 /DNA_END=387 /DNA_ORIENTATION=+
MPGGGGPINTFNPLGGGGPPLGARPKAMTGAKGGNAEPSGHPAAAAATFAAFVYSLRP